MAQHTIYDTIDLINELCQLDLFKMCDVVLGVLIFVFSQRRRQILCDFSPFSFAL